MVKIYYKNVTMRTNPVRRLRSQKPTLRTRIKGIKIIIIFPETNRLSVASAKQRPWTGKDFFFLFHL